MTSRAVSTELFEAARLGDRQALVNVLEQAQPDIRRYARTACRTAADAEDAAQEALWLLFRHVGTIRALASLPAWLFSVVRRECLRLARRAGLVTTIELESDDLLQDRPETDLRLDLAAAFEALPAQLREIAMLRDFREMTIDEISSSTNLSRQAVKARLHRARVLLREYLLR